MGEDSTRQGVLFEGLFGRPLRVRFDQPASSSDGGAVLLSALDRRLRLSSALASRLTDSRQAAKVRHSLWDLMRQRVYGVICGYEDCNDSARLRDDPVLKLLLGRDPIRGESLASQATLSRFENSLERRALWGLGEAFAQTLVAHHRRRLGPGVRRVTIDLDVTDDPTHGSQQGSLFNGHYREYCLLPLAGFVQFGEEKEQHLVALVLRPGNADARKGAVGLLRRLFRLLRSAFPRARLRVRLDGGFNGPRLLAFLERQGVEYVMGLPGNEVLERAAEPYMAEARHLAMDSGRGERVYGEAGYRAGSWRRYRRVIIKAEVTRYGARPLRDNDRYLVTNLPHDPESVYAGSYCPRGEIENRLKELQYGLKLDRLSCHAFTANQFRLLLTACAYALLQELRLQAAGTAAARWQVSTLRERLLKLGAWLQASTRRLTLHLPRDAPWQAEWRRVASSLGALAP